MLDIDKKEYRNLPEQVLWNKEQIENWIKSGGVAEILELTPEPNIYQGVISQDVVDRLSGKPLAFVFCAQDVYVKYTENTAIIGFLGLRLTKENHLDHTDVKLYGFNILKQPKKWVRYHLMNLETYDKAQLDVILQTLKKNSFQDVNLTTYPTLNDFLASTGEEGYIYLYPVNVSDLSKGYMMYIWESSAWRYLGTTVLDLSNYYNKSETDHLLAGKSTKYEGAYVGDETKFTLDMTAGDIIMERTGGQLLINEITFSGDTLTKVVLVGLEDNGNPVVHKYESGAWTSINYIDSNFVNKAEQTFRKMTAGEWTNLTSDEKILQLQKGVIIDGTISGIKNPILFPYTSVTSAGGWGFVVYGDTYELQILRIYTVALGGSTKGIVNLSGQYGISARVSAISPIGSNINVGSPTLPFHNGYFSNVLSDGTNSVTVADLANLITYAKAQGWIS